MPQPLSVARIYGESVRAWRTSLVTLTVLAVLLEAPIVLAELFLHVGVGIKISTEQSVTLSAVSVPIALYGSLSHHFLSGLLERLVGSSRRGHPQPSIGEVVHDLPWARLLGADIALTALVVIGYLAFIVPGVILATWLTPLLVVVNLERRTVRQSMVRSYQLVRGHFWRVFLVGFVALVIVEGMVAVAATLAETLWHSFAFEVLISSVPAAVLMPIGALPIVVLTFDLVALADAPRRDLGLAPTSDH